MRTKAVVPRLSSRVGWTRDEISQGISNCTVWPPKTEEICRHAVLWVMIAEKEGRHLDEVAGSSMRIPDVEVAVGELAKPLHSPVDMAMVSLGKQHQTKSIV